MIYIPIIILMNIKYVRHISAVVRAQVLLCEMLISVAAYLQADEGKSISDVHRGWRLEEEPTDEPPLPDPDSQSRSWCLPERTSCSTSQGEDFLLQRALILTFMPSVFTRANQWSTLWFLSDKTNRFVIETCEELLWTFRPFPLRVGGSWKPSCTPLSFISATFDSSAGVRTRGIAQIKSIHVLRQKLTPFHSSASLMPPFRTCVPFQSAPSPHSADPTSPQVISNTLEM